MRAGKVIEALGGCSAAGRKLAELTRRQAPISRGTVLRWKHQGFPPIWAFIIRKHSRELGLKTWHLMDCQLPEEDQLHQS